MSRGIEKNLRRSAEGSARRSRRTAEFRARHGVQVPPEPPAPGQHAHPDLVRLWRAVGEIERSLEHVLHVERLPQLRDVFALCSEYDWPEPVSESFLRACESSVRPSGLSFVFRRDTQRGWDREMD